MADTPSEQARELSAWKRAAGSPFRSAVRLSQPVAGQRH